MKTHFRKSGLSGLVALATCMVAGFGVTGCGKHASVAEETMPVDVALPMVDSVTLHKEYPGYLKADNTVEVVGRVNGTLTSVRYQGGDNVKAGQVLFTIDPTQYQAAVQQAQANLDEAKSNYDYYSKEYQAMSKALESDAVSRMEVVQAQSNMLNAQASIADAQAALKIARDNLGYCTVTAPISGQITTNVYGVGNYIAGSGSPVTLATIYSNSKMKAEFQVDDTRYNEIIGVLESNQNIDFDHLDIVFEQALPHTYTAKLNYTAPLIDQSTGTIEFHAVVDNPYGELRDGMYMKILIPYRFEPHAVMVNDASISTDQQGKYLYTVNDSNKIVYTPIVVGEMANDSMRVVTSGLKPGTPYVTKAIMKVRDGMTVKPVMKK